MAGASLLAKSFVNAVWHHKTQPLVRGEVATGHGRPPAGKIIHVSDVAFF